MKHYISLLDNLYAEILDLSEDEDKHSDILELIDDLQNKLESLNLSEDDYE